MITKKIGKLLRRIGSRLVQTGMRMSATPSRKICSGPDRSLYKTPDGNLYWLNSQGYLDKKIIEEGVFELHSTNLVHKLIKKGDVVLDVGANIGYYAVIFSKLVGESGKVHAFEPTEHFLAPLRENLKINNITNVEVHTFGLSDKVQSLLIDIGPSSATLHSPLGFDTVLRQERIALSTLDVFVEEAGIQRIDFIKIDIDGHEPLFFEGAWRTILKFSPKILFEISHLHYLQAGIVAWDFFEKLKSYKLYIYDEVTLKEVKTKEEFLRRCSNFDKSSNVVISLSPIEF